MADETAGDPMKALKWTRKSTRKTSRELKRRKIAASPRTVARLLKKQLHFSLKGNRKAITGTQHPDRDRQFQYIAKMRKRFAAAGEPEISVDAKKKSSSAISIILAGLGVGCLTRSAIMIFVQPLAPSPPRTVFMRSV